MKIDIRRATAIQKTGRVQQLQGMFDVPPAVESVVEWDCELPVESRPWNVGLIVGPSGCGKSTIAKELFSRELIQGFDWPSDKSIVDSFPTEMGIKEITLLLSSVGFSSPPSWLRPFHVLSNGEQFRVTVARALAEQSELAVIDEFTSVVDRQVAQVGSAAVAKTVRKSGRKLVAVSCHYDIIDWLDPDWIFEPHTGQTQWRSERRPRPAVNVEVVRCRTSAWQLFKQHHYLSGEIHKAATCFLGLVDSRPAAFCAALNFPHHRGSFYREHRCVVLPDFQGIGLGEKLSSYVASLFVASGKPYRITSGHPAVAAARIKSGNWACVRKPSLVSGVASNRNKQFEKSVSTSRLTWSFQYAGPTNREDAKRFGLRVL